MPRKPNKSKKPKNKKSSNVSQNQLSNIHINIGERRAPRRRAPAKKAPSSGSVSSKEQIGYVNPLRQTLLTNMQPSSITGIGELAKVLSSLQNNSSINYLGQGRVNPRYAYDSLTEQRLAQEQRIINDSFGSDMANVSDSGSFLGKIDENKMQQVRTGFEPIYMQSNLYTPTFINTDDEEEEELPPNVKRTITRSAPEPEVIKDMSEEKEGENKEDEPLVKTLTIDEFVNKFFEEPKSVKITELKNKINTVEAQKKLFAEIKQRLKDKSDDYKIPSNYINAFNAFIYEDGKNTKMSNNIKKRTYLKKLQDNINL